MRLVIAQCTVDYVGRLTAHLPSARRLLLFKADGKTVEFQATILLLTPKEVEYFRHGGLLHYVLRQLAA